MKNNNLLSRSHRATCGITEREITVPISKHSSTAQMIRSRGYNVVGDSKVPGGRKRSNVKIWFTTGPGL